MAERRLTIAQRAIWLERCVVIDSMRQPGDISTLHGLLLDLNDADAEIAALRERLDKAEMSGECLGMVAATLAELGCEHGPGTHAATPPMMYPEWIACVVRHAVRRETERLRAVVDAACAWHEARYPMTDKNHYTSLIVAAVDAYRAAQKE